MRWHHVDACMNGHGQEMKISCCTKILFTYRTIMHCAWRSCECTTTTQGLRCSQDAWATVAVLKFSGMSAYVKYVDTCDTCARGKASSHAPYGELALLPVLVGPWRGTSCDFVVNLPVSNGHDANKRQFDATLEMNIIFYLNIFIIISFLQY